MNGFEQFMLWLDSRMTTPTSYGWYHLLCWGIMIVACALIYIFRKKISPKAVNITIIVSGVVLLIFELLKQLSFSFHVDGAGNAVWNFNFSNFPFQFCSTPMYLLLIVGFFKKGQIRESILSYLGTFAFFAGLIVMIIPNDVFISQIFINIHTMIWHGGMVIIGFLLLATRTVRLNFKSVYKATIVFVIMLIIALLMNIIAHHVNPESDVNMFYIGPYIACHLPLLSLIYPAVPWIIFFIMYTAGFFAVACIIMGIAIGFDKLERRKEPVEVTDKIIKIIKSDL
ncbi:MAG: YwaF family protein [Clostridia bacterium]|nr:YwaF family protein [Clostridia bacterium]